MVKKSLSLSKKALSIFLVALMLTSCFVFAPSIEKASALGSLSGGYTQTHVVSNYQNAYKNYTYISNCAVPMDGSNGNPDYCIPGLSQADNLVPQGMTLWKEKNWILISAYDPSSSNKRPSVVFALDFSNGDLVAQFNLYESATVANTSHASGIACSHNNLYYANEGSTISYIPLSELDVEVGTVKNVVFAGTTTFASVLNNANTSYASFGDETLWTGNFYLDGNSEYQTKANDAYPSIVIGCNVSGYTSSVDEWNAVRTMATTNNPSYIIPLPGIDKVQCALVDDGKVFVGTSYGRKNNSNLYVYDVNLKSSGTITMTVNGTSKNGYNAILRHSYEHIPMTEGMFVLDGNMYNSFESAAWTYNGSNPSNVSKDPSDVIWRFDVEALKSGNISIEGNYTGFNSSEPFFRQHDNSYKSVATRYYSNIAYTEECFSSHNGTSNGNNNRGNAVTFSLNSDAAFNFEVYYANTVLIYDGINDMTFPAMTAGKVSDVNKTRVVYTCYPTTSTSFLKDNHVPNHPNIVSLAVEKNDSSYDFRGSYNVQTLDFTYATDNQSDYHGSSSGNPNQRYSDNYEVTSTGNVFSRKYHGHWGHYGTGFVVKNPDFSSHDGKWTSYNPNWVFYGDSGNSNNKKEYQDKNMKGISGASSKTIYVINYKRLLDKVGSVGTQGTIKDDYSKLKDNEWKYTDASWAAYMNAINELINFNPMTFSYIAGVNNDGQNGRNTTDNSLQNGVIACTNRIDELMAAYDTAKSNLEYRNVDVLYDNEFDFDSYVFSSVTRGQDLIVDKQNNSITFTKNSADAYTAPYDSIAQTGYMYLTPGHKYRITYDYSYTGATRATGVRFMAFAYPNTDLNSSEWTLLDSTESISRPSGSGTHVVKDQTNNSEYWTVPEGKPYVTIRFGVVDGTDDYSTNLDGTFTFSNLVIRDITETEKPTYGLNSWAKPDSAIKTGTNLTNQKLPKPEYDGYLFEGWYTEKNGAGELYEGNELISSAKSIHLWSNWIEEPEAVTWITDEALTSDAYNFIGVSKNKPGDMVLHSKSGTPGGISTTATGTYGTMTIANGSITYVPATMQFNDTDNFWLLTEVKDSVYAYVKASIIPARAIYYEDNCGAITYSGNWTTNVPQSVANAMSGENFVGDSNAANYSGQVAHKTTVSASTSSWPSASFTFAGTGFDVVSLTNSNSGLFVVSVFKNGVAVGEINNYEAYQLVDTYYGYSYGRIYKDENGKPTLSVTDKPMYNGKGGGMTETPTTKENGAPDYAYGWLESSGANSGTYQVPVLSIDGLDYGTYNVIIEARYSPSPLLGHGKDSYDLYLDGIRIHNPADNNSVVKQTYASKGENYVKYEQINKKTLTSGAILIDGGKVVSAAELSSYTQVMPNNEIYLSQGQTIAFTLDCDNFNKVELGMRSASSPSASAVVAHGNASATGRTVTVGGSESYYELEGIANGDTITITNNSNSILALTNLRISSNNEIGNAPKMSVRAYTAPKAMLMLAMDFDEPETETVPEETTEETTVPITEETTEDVTEETTTQVTEPQTEPTEPTSQPNDNGSDEAPAKLNFFQKIIQFFRNIFKKIFK